VLSLKTGVRRLSDSSRRQIGRENQNLQLVAYAQLNHLTTPNTQSIFISSKLHSSIQNHEKATKLIIDNLKRETLTSLTWNELVRDLDTNHGAHQL